MATSGSKSIAVTSYDTLRFNWSRSSYSIENNTSTISWNLQLIAGSYGYISSSASKDWRVSINGQTWSGRNTVGISNNTTKTLASGTAVIAHNADGSKTFSYSFSQEFAITFSGSYIGTKSGSGTGTLDTIPRAATILSAPNFNDIDNPTITYTNPAGNAVTKLDACISLTGALDDIGYRDISKTGSSYTFNLTDAERNKLIDAVSKGSSRTVRFYVRTTIGDTKYLSSITKTFTIVDGTPTLAPTATIATDSTTYGLTGSDDIFIKNYTYVTVAANATPRKRASITSYKIENGGKYISTASGVIQGVTSPTFKFGVTDSRGNYVTQTLTKTLVDYVIPTCYLTTTNPTTGGVMNFTIKGDCFNGSFGFVTNQVTVQYRVKPGGEEYGEWKNINITTSGNTYIAEGLIGGLDYKNTYTIQAQVIDYLYTKQSVERTVKTIPVYDWSENDFNLNVNLHMNSAGTVLRNNNDGSTVVSANNDDNSTGVFLRPNGTDDDTGQFTVYPERVESSTPIYINGIQVAANKILWQGAWYMTEAHTFTLTERISNQASGIVLVFSRFSNGAVVDGIFHSFFVPKELVNKQSSASYSFTMSTPNFSHICCKSLFINDTTVTGNSYNSTTGTSTSSGITYDNSAFVLRFVIGV